MKKIGCEKICFLIILSAASTCILATNSGAAGGEAAEASGFLDFLQKKSLIDIGTETISLLSEISIQEYVNIISTNPNIMEPKLQGVTNYFMGLLAPLFITAILLSGIYIMAFTGTPKTRSEVKSMLPRIIIAMVLVIISASIINVFLWISESITKEALKQGPESPMDLLLGPGTKGSPIEYFMEKFTQIGLYSAEASAPFLFIGILLLAGVLIVAISRYLVISLLVMIFPLTVFLYLITPTRRIGRILLEQTVVWGLLQCAMAVTLVSVVTLLDLVGPIITEELLVLLKVSGLIVLILVPSLFILTFRNFIPT